MYDCEQVFGGWIVRKDIPGSHTLYLVSVYGGKCTWSRDYLYAKKYTEKTARKYAGLLNLYR